MRALAIAALVLAAAGCNQVIGVDKFTSIDASAPAPDSAIDATLEFDAPTIDAPSAIDARPDATPPDAPVSCGDNMTQPPEQCDTGAVDTSTCDSDCSFPMCGDGHTNTHYTNPANGKLEQCDGAGVDTSTCNKDCTLPACGDGYINGAAGETCDTTSDTATCDSDCTAPACGDGHTNTHFVVPGTSGKTEQCDKGASNSDNAGTTCTTHCQLPACGDGILEPGEGCDDNNKNSGDGCSSTCAIEGGYSCSGSPSVCSSVCGDGIVVGTEVCDDDNANACGTCNATCSATIPSTAATGSFNWGGGSATSALDGAVIVLDDGINPPTSFEWDDNGSFAPAHVPIPFNAGQGGSQTAQGFTNAVNAVGPSLLITATSTPPNATLVDDRKTSLGNRPIQVMFANGLFTMTGMSGGAAGDCPSGQGCKTPSDCASGACTANVCQ